MTPFTIYLWQQADRFDTPFITGGMLLSLASIIMFVLNKISQANMSDCLKSIAVYDSPHYKEKFEEWEKVNRATAKRIPKMVAAAVFCWLVVALLPSSKTIAMMVAIPAIANSEPIQKDIPELYQLAKEALKEQITGQKPAK